MKVKLSVPFPSLSQSVHGNDIKIEETFSLSGNSDHNLIDPFPGIQADSSSLSTAGIGNPRAKSSA